MKIKLKTEKEIEKIRNASIIVAECLDYLKDFIKPGIPTSEVNKLGDDFIRSKGGEAAFKGYHGYPASVCISLNNEVVHGIPSSRKIIKEGDIVSLDIGVKKDGYYGDGAKTYSAGEVNDEAKRLMRITKKALKAGIEEARPGNKLGDISAKIQKICEDAGCSVVRDLVGHGIGRSLHEPPQIPNFGKKNTGPALKPGMTFAIEPMVNLGACNVDVLSDNWTVVTSDGSLSAHYEHTVAITENGPVILTTLSN